MIGKVSSEMPVLTYVGDPMCSWCYGFQKEISSVLERVENEVKFRLIMGGLHQHIKDPMDEKFRVFLLNHWREVSLKTGQQFSFDLLKKEGFIYNTIPACRAVVTAGLIAPNKSLDYLHLLQTFFFLDNKDTNDITTYLELAEILDIDRSTFEYLYKDNITNQKTLENLSISLSLNARVLPTVILTSNEKSKLIACGYTEKERMLFLLKEELRKVNVI